MMTTDPLARLPVTLSPDGALLRYYALVSLVAGPFFFVPLLPLYFRYHTLRYEVDDEGITMRWGILFRREISLNYARIQDIHLSSNVVERWLGLAKVQIQTASGAGGAEMTIEGLKTYQRLRDFLYARMRGARDEPGDSAAGPGAGAGAGTAMLPASGLDELTATLRSVAEEVRALRETLGARTERPVAAHDADAGALRREDAPGSGADEQAAGDGRDRGGDRA